MFGIKEFITAENGVEVYNVWQTERIDHSILLYSGLSVNQGSKDHDILTAVISQSDTVI